MFTVASRESPIMVRPRRRTDGPIHCRCGPFHGPQYDAVSKETGLVDGWPQGGPPILWSRNLGQGYSGLVAVGDRVFTQFQSRSGQFVVCLDADSGAEIWSERVDWPWQPAGG